MAIPDHMFKDLAEKYKDNPQLAAAIAKSRAKSLSMRKELVASKEVAPNKPFLETDTPVHTCQRFTYSCGNTTELPGAEAAKEDTDISALDQYVQKGHENAGIVRQFHKEVLKRNSYDNQGIDLISCCHYDKNYDNAFFDGSRMIYGDGQLFLPLVLALDVASHEIGHGIVQATANLNYVMESGALNESFADVFGETCQHYAENTKIADSDWLIGEQIMSPELKSEGWKAIRSFKNEKSYPDDPQPKHKKQYVHSFEDNFGVHINSGIPNRAFYEFCVNSKCDYSFKEPLEVWYNALLALNKFSGFSACKKATMTVCRKLHPELLTALSDAWETVGL